MNKREILIPWDGQPQEAVVAADGVSAVWVGPSPIEVVSQYLPTLTVNASQQVGRIGRSLRVTGQASSNRAVLKSLPGRDQIGTGDFTVLVIAELRRTDVGYAVLGRWNSGNSPGTNEWFIGSGGTGGISSGDLDFWVEVGSTTYQVKVTSAVWSTNVPYLLAGRRKGTTLYVDRCNLNTGVWHSGSTTNAGITTVNSVSARNLTIGELAASASINADVDLYAAATFPRSLTDAEIVAAASQQLWGMLFASRRVVVPAAGSSLPTLSLPTVINITSTSVTPQVTITV